MASVYVKPVDPLTLDHDNADAMAACSTAAAAADGLTVAASTGPAVAAMLRYGHDNRPFDGAWLARDEQRRLLGWATLELPVWDNPHMAVVFCSVQPDARARGVGTALLAAQTEMAQAAGRSLLLTFGFRESAGAQFLLDHGFEVGQLTSQRRLEMQRLDYERLASLAKEAAAATADYEIVEFVGSTPEPLLPAMSKLFEAINDAPLDEAAFEATAYPVERVRRYEAAMAARGQHVYRLVARHRRTQEWAGLTILCVDSLRPGVAMQEDTSVLPAHRGHRLGLLLKARMLLWMRERHPELETIDTWNADSNRHMIAVNEQLGCFVVARGYVLQRHLSRASRRRTS